MYSIYFKRERRNIMSLWKVSTTTGRFYHYIEQREPYLLETKVDTTILAFYVNLSLLRFQENLLLGKRVFCCSVQEKEEKEKNMKKLEW